MIIIVEGPECVGKTTLVKKLSNELALNHPDLPVFVLKLSNFLGLTASQSELYSKQFYRHLFDLLFVHISDYHFILDRGHIGEFVYSSTYRNYNGEYVYDIEHDFARLLSSQEYESVRLVVLLDSVDNLLARDDGKSLSKSFTAKNDEVCRFGMGAHRSTLMSHIISCANKDPTEVFMDVIFALFKQEFQGSGFDENL